MAGVGVDPGDHEHRVALLHDPADEGVLGLQVHDVELVDPGRDDQQRPPVHRVGGRAVLDQLHHVVPVDHLAGRDRDIAAQAEGALVGLVRPDLAMAARQIRDEVLHAVQHAGAAAVERGALRLRVGGEQVGRRHGVGEELQEERGLVAGVLVQPLGLVGQPLAPAAVHQIGLLDGVEPDVVGPGLVGEPAVAAVRRGDRRRLDAEHPADGALPDGHVLLAELCREHAEPHRIGGELLPHRGHRVRHGARIGDGGGGIAGAALRLPHPPFGRDLRPLHRRPHPQRPPIEQRGSTLVFRPTGIRHITLRIRNCWRCGG